VVGIGVGGLFLDTTETKKNKTGRILPVRSQIVIVARTLSAEGDYSDQYMFPIFAPVVVIRRGFGYRFLEEFMLTCDALKQSIGPFPSCFP
jgi:hypothetical protein